MSIGSLRSVSRHRERRQQGILLFLVLPSSSSPCLPCLSHLPPRASLLSVHGNCCRLHHRQGVSHRPQALPAHPRTGDARSDYEEAPRALAHHKGYGTSGHVTAISKVRRTRWRKGMGVEHGEERSQEEEWSDGERGGEERGAEEERKEEQRRRGKRRGGEERGGEEERRLMR
eukprot:768573-Hanusia_phi.AAC.2